MPSNDSNVRKRVPGIPLAKVKTDSDSSSIEEVVRHPTFYEQLAAQQAAAGGKPLNIKKIKIPLGKKLAQDELIQDFIVEEYDVPADDDDDETGKGHEDGNEEEEAVLGDAGQAFFFTIPLEMLLIMFDLLVFYQYREEFSYAEVMVRAIKSFIRK